MLINKKQLSLLSDRYYDCLLGDFSSLLWMVGQAPLVAGLVILRFQSFQATQTLYFVISLSCVWFGCINSCREIAKENEIYKREKMHGLNKLSYLLSKVYVLNTIGLIEVGLFYIILTKFLDLDLNVLLSFITLWVLYFSGMALGLMISRWSGHVSKAVVSVPVMIIPQIVFSKFVLPENTLKGLALKIEKLMVVKWGFQALTHVEKNNIEFKGFSISLINCIGLGVLFLFLTYLHFLFIEED